LISDGSLPAIDLSEYSVAVVGCGSIGTRHLRNLRSLRVGQLFAVDSDEARSSKITESLAIQSFRNIDETVSAHKIDAVFVCTPPVDHIPIAIDSLRSGAHVFIEKPVSHSLARVEELASEAARRKRVVQVGYNLRFHPGICAIERLVREMAVGRILWARAEVGQYLPDWRPSQDYRHSYTANREMGGGIILDASHEIDYFLWIFGEAVELTCMAGRVSNLAVDVEDCATVLIRFASGTQADIHMDFVQREYSRSCVLAGEQGNITWNYKSNLIEIQKAGEEPRRVTQEFEGNEMYMAEAAHFFECIQMNAVPRCSLADARKALDVALAARTSAQERRWVSLVD
jgi:predicted dehydrogenase